MLVFLLLYNTVQQHQGCEDLLKGRVRIQSGGCSPAAFENWNRPGADADAQNHPSRFYTLRDCQAAVKALSEPNCRVKLESRGNFCGFNGARTAAHSNGRKRVGGSADTRNNQPICRRSKGSRKLLLGGTAARDSTYGPTAALLVLYIKTHGAQVQRWMAAQQNR